MSGCKFCDERGLPCLLCGQAIMRYQFDRSRCGNCAQANRPPREWSIFCFCPYCGRKLTKQHSEEPEDEKQEDENIMRKNHKWTVAEERLLVESIREGCSRADLCDKLGLEESVVYNHYRAMRASDKSLPLFPRAEKQDAAQRDDGEHGKIVVAPPWESSMVRRADGETMPEAEEKKAELNPLEQEMADIIAENNATIEGLREALAVEEAARAEEAAAYQREINKLIAQRDGLQGAADGYVAEIHEKDEALKKAYGELDRARIERDEAQALVRALESSDVDEWASPEEESALASGIIESMHKELISAQDETVALTERIHERDEVIFSMAKAIFLGTKAVIPV